ncbi:MAG: ORF6N domain-containing protein [Proteiniphilum sp.]|uniref:ORF6N domain-containing protein n=1 Tax=Proteiniphilum sp. TaxID=1926877 RepID=UPI002B2081C8|nr:ORF6N domain-containing protein [Proteiniphilum sp.]MEA5127671.1 ORF6N domain-containing protein [Proteiniphilum sp.]
MQSKIYQIRNESVMIDRDLAVMYGIETRVLNQAVKRNIGRFPPDFMFQLTQTEWENISSQFVMTSRTKRPKSALPFAFTEHGVVMLSSVLRSDVAIAANIFIVRAFVALRQVVSSPANSENKYLKNEIKELKQYIEEVFADQNDINEDTRIQLELINQSLAELQATNKLAASRPRKQIGFISNSDETTK